MEIGRYDFRAVEVVLANKIISILSRIIGRKHNIQINFYFVSNPVFVFTILTHRAFHFCKIRLLGSLPTSHSAMREALDFWFTQGAEVELREADLSAEECPPLSMCIINHEDPKKIKHAVSAFTKNTKFIVYQKLMVDSRANDIWSFMHPIWAVGDILEFEEVSVSGETYFILVCEKRG
jgi:hypothetical protein